MKLRLHLFSVLVFYGITVSAQSGSLDSTFSEDGIDIRDLSPGSSDISYAGLLQSDGKIVAAGWSNANGITAFAIVRYLTDGSGDPSFGNDGIVLTGYNNLPGRGQAVAIQPDGKILIAGTTDQNAQSDYSLTRLHPDGSTDTTFGQVGWVVTDLGTVYEYPNAVAVQADGKIIVAGKVDEASFADFGMVRYHPDGQLDTLFGNKGIVITDFREEDLPTAMLIQPDGRIILGGFSSVSANGDFTLARYNPDGTLDKSFGTGGKVLTDLEGFDQSDYINELVMLDDGKILATGNANNSNLDFTSDIGIVRYDSDGSVDESFGENGVVIHSLGGRTNVGGLAVQNDGKMVICGDTDAFGEKRYFLTRYNPNGRIDSTFATNGLVTTSFAGFSSAATDVNIQPDTRIVVTGVVGPSPTHDFAAIRYIADFVIALDILPVTCFGGSDGGLMVEVSGGAAPYVYSLDGVTFQTSPVFSELASGTYNIFIQDANGTGISVVAGPYMITQPNMPPFVTIEAPHDGNWIFVSVEGDADGFLYSIDGGANFQADSAFYDLEDGVYSVVVMDAIGCVIYTEDILISTVGIAALSNSLPFNISPIPNDGSFTLDMDNTSGEKFELRAIDMTGKIVYSSLVSEYGHIKKNFDLGFLREGVYQIWLSNGQTSGVRKMIVAR